MLVLITFTVQTEENLKLNSGDNIIVRENGTWLFLNETKYENIKVEGNPRKLLIIESIEGEDFELIIEVMNNNLSEANVFLRFKSSLGMAGKTDTVNVKYRLNKKDKESNWVLINDNLIRYPNNPFFFFNDITETNTLTFKIYNEANFYRQSEFNIEGLNKILENYRSYEKVSEYTDEVYVTSKIISMATDVGGLGDQSFNDNTYKGLEKAKKEFGVRIRVIESVQQVDYIPNLRSLAEDGSDLVFAVGFLMEEAVKKVAKNKPNTYFAGIDIGAGEDDPNNFKGILYKEEQAGYLAGIVAGMMTKEYADRSDKLNDDNVVGVVLGMQIPPVENYEVGFIQGVKRVNPNCEVLSVTAGTFTDQEKGKEAATALINAGADVIFQTAGLTGIGVIKEAKNRNVIAIGVDTDQNHIAPNTVITSAEKKIPQTVYLAVKEVVDGNFTGGTNVYGLKQEAVGISPFHRFDDVVPQAVREEIEKAKEEIINGDIVIKRTRKAIGR